MDSIIRSQAADITFNMTTTAFDTMLVQADVAGADAVIGIRYDATEVMSGVTEVICYGTAVKVEPLAD